MNIGISKGSEVWAVTINGLKVRSFDLRGDNYACTNARNYSGYLQNNPEECAGVYELAVKRQEEKEN